VNVTASVFPTGVVFLVHPARKVCYSEETDEVSLVLLPDNWGSFGCPFLFFKITVFSSYP
jgi:hypothetical protein